MRQACDTGREDLGAYGTLPLSKDKLLNCFAWFGFVFLPALGRDVPLAPASGENHRPL